MKVFHCFVLAVVLLNQRETEWSCTRPRGQDVISKTGSKHGFFLHVLPKPGPPRAPRRPDNHVPALPWPRCTSLMTRQPYKHPLHEGRGFARQEAVFHQHFKGYRRSSTKKGENTFPQTAAPPSSTLLWQEEPAQLTSPQTRQLAKKLQKMFFSPKGNHKLQRVRTPTVLRQQ
nr:uncharacterized protein LOC106828835 isoform X2 [Equus asinus]XP_044602655.1 uncharacterized protein LOC106828835 isoform X2 [Equus asinus]